MRATLGIGTDGSIAHVADLVVHAERAGFGSCWVYDHGLVTHDVYVTLAAVAQATERIALGPGITNPYTRHPATTAGAVAALDELSGGRAFVGLGVGGGLTLDPVGIAARRPLAAVSEATEVMRLLFAGGAVDYAGETVTITGARLPYARADLEIWIAGRGPRILELGGRAADGVHLSYLHEDVMADAVTAIRAAAGDRPLKLSYTTMIVTTDAELETARDQMSFRLVDSPPDIRDRIDLSPADVESLRAELGAGGPAGAGRLVVDDWVLPFVISGTLAECRAELDRRAARDGLDEFQVTVLDIDQAESLIERGAALVDGEPLLGGEPGP